MRPVFVRFTTAVLVALALTACKEATLGPSATGTIEGRVLNDDTGEPVPGVSITTSPATSAPVTGSDGRFRLPDIETGDYTVSARKSGFESASVSVTVRRDRITDATILLLPEPETELMVEVTSLRNSTTEGDSVFADVQYRVENASGDSIVQYEVYFEIYTPDAVLQHEDERGDLRPGETDINDFRRFIGSDPADSVVITDVFF